MALPEDLLEQAQFLATREPKRPRQASLRRAVSTAYYALFHLLIREAVKHWRRPAERNLLGRMFEHSVMKKACLRTRDAFKSTREPNLQSLSLIAGTFVQMQQHRHTADYDNDNRWSRVDALNQVNSVAASFSAWKGIRKDPEAQKFLVSLLIKER
jgi:uncharacterized protein (UPF0332 family)